MRGKKKTCRSLRLENIPCDTVSSRWWSGGHGKSHLKCSCIRRWRTASAAWNAKHTRIQTHISLPFFSPPLLSNLGHILCGRLGHTTPLGFAGIWRTAGPSLNLNIWITGRCVNTPLCLTFLTFSLLKLSLRVLRLIFFFAHHLFIPSPAPHQWYAHPVHSHPILSGSVSCHIHLKCAYTLN